VATAFVLGPVQLPTQCPVLGQGLALPCTWPRFAPSPAPRTVTFALSNRNRNRNRGHRSHGPVTWPCDMALWYCNRGHRSQGPVTWPCDMALCLCLCDGIAIAVTDIAKVNLYLRIWFPRRRVVYRCGGDVPVHANICVGKGQGPASRMCNGNGKGNGKAGHMSQGPVHGHVQWQGHRAQGPGAFTYPISDCKDICNCKVMILVVVRGLRGRAHVTCATPLARAS